MFFHWQNLNEKQLGSKRVKASPWRNGRAWWHFNEDGHPTKVIRVEWHLGDFRFHLGFDLKGSDHEVLICLVVPFVSLYIGLEGMLRWKWLWALVGYDTRGFGIRIFDWAIWWSFFENEMESRSSDPKWMRGNFNLRDFLLGRSSYKKVVLEKRQIRIPLPEGLYLAEAEFQVCTWKRKHWPWWPLKLVRNFTEVSVLQWGGLPFEGKGENSYDCGTDGLYGYTVEGHNLDKAISEGVFRTLENRRRYGGAEIGYYRNPMVDKPEGLKPFAEYVARCFKSEDKHPMWPKSKLAYKNDGPLLHIHHARENRPQVLTVVQSAMTDWPAVLRKAMETVKLEEETASEAQV